MAENLGDAVLELRTDDRNLDRGMRRAERGAERLDDQFEETSRSARNMGRTITRAIQGIVAVVGVGVLSGFVGEVVDAGVKVDQLRRQFTAATGSIEAGGREFEFVTELAQKLGTNLEASAASYARLTAASRGTAISARQTRQIFTSVSEAAAVLGLSAEQTGGALTAIEQIISKGNVSAEELRGQLGERLPGAFQIAARAIGVTTSELDKMLRLGELTAAELLPALSEELRRTFGPSVPDAVESATSAFGRLENAVFRLKAALADSGLVEALADVANGIADIVAPALQLEIQNTTSRIEEMTARIAELRAQQGTGSPRAQLSQGTELSGLIQQLEAAEVLLDSLLEQQGRLVEGPVSGNIRNDAGVMRALDTFKQASDELDEFIAKADRMARPFETAEERVARLQEELRGMQRALDPEVYARAMADIEGILFEGIEEIDTNRIQAMRRAATVAGDQMSEQWQGFVQTASRSLHRTFSAAFSGVSTNFRGLLRNMAADLAASSVLRFVGGLIGGPVGAFISSSIPRFARGGRPPVGSPYLVGEQGPEVRIDDRPGTIVSNRDMMGSGGVNQTMNFGIAFPAELEAYIRNVAAPAGRDAAVQTMRATRGRLQ